MYVCSITQLFVKNSKKNQQFIMTSIHFYHNKLVFFLSNLAADEAVMQLSFTTGFLPQNDSFNR